MSKTVLKATLSEQGVKLFTMRYCPFCERAKALLKQRGIAYEEVLIEESEDAEWDALYLLSRMRTMPQIFAGKRLVGGYNELKAQDQLDQLASLK